MTLDKAKEEYKLNRDYAIENIHNMDIRECNEHMRKQNRLMEIIVKEQKLFDLST